MVLDNAVVYQSNRVTGHVGVRIYGVGDTMRCPTGVGDAADTIQRRFVQQRLQVIDLAPGSQPLEATVLLHSDTGRIIAPVLERPQAGDQNLADITVGGGPYDATHELSILALFGPFPALDAGLPGPA